MKIEYLNIENLIPYEFNNKIHDEDQINKIANSIKEFGFLQPVVIDNNNVIVVWHWRVNWAKKIWLTEIPCIRAEELSDAQIKKYRILDNKLNESERNEENLRLEIEELWNLDFGDIHMDLSDFNISMDNNDSEIIEDDIPEIDETKELIVKEWDIFQLWKHRLMCWDSNKIEDFELLMEWEDIDMVFTDPPYNIWYSWVKDKRSIQNDKMEDSDFVKFLKSSLQYCDTTYVCCSWQYSHLFKQAMEELGMKPKAMIIRNKVNPAQNLDKYFKQHEIIFYYWKFWGEKTLRWDIWEVKRQKILFIQQWNQ